ncbi:GSCOCG00008164001-RA-CDS [Cotesia congregata]|nr:GSCOCG00008164001-RA-CDS [Cotesia congregata]
MAPSKRRPLHNSTGSGSPGSSFRSRGMNFRPNSGVQEDRGGTRPTAPPSSVGAILISMVIHLCKKSLLFEPRLKIVIYCGAIFIVSLIADFIPMPKSYFSRSDNIFNRYFVKWGWGWLLTVTIPWVALTGHTLGCGKRPILVKHLARIVLATAAWLLWTKLFHFIETNHGRCLNTKDLQLQTKTKCLQAGKFWSGFDISGHTFILIYSSLILAEEASSFLGWEGIRDLIMKEEYSRTTNEISSGMLRNLSDTDLGFLKKAHNVFTPWLRGLFIIMTLQQLLWDIMLVSTILYYHIMIEKFIGGVIAILTWYVTYKWLFKLPKCGLLAPGEGVFRYYEPREPLSTPPSSRLRRSTLNGNTPTFMGMPIRTPQPQSQQQPPQASNDTFTSRQDSDTISTR